jgi:hypothetical protein
LSGASPRRPAGRWRFNLFDGFVLAGAAVNLAVVAVLVGYWLTR